MGLLLKQLAILLWKGWVMRRCHWISTIFELLFPILMALSIALIYHSDSNERYSSGSRRSTEGWLGPVYYSDVNHYKLDPLFDHSKDILYTPVTNFTRDLMSVLVKKFPKVSVVPVDSVSQIMVFLINDTDRYYYSSRYSMKIGVVLTGSTPEALDLTIRIRSYNLGDAARVTFAKKYRIGPASAHGYDGSAKAYDPYRELGIFTKTQIAVTEAYFDYLCNKKGIDRSESKALVSEVAPQEIPFPMYYRPPGSGKLYSRRVDKLTTVEPRYVQRNGRRVIHIDHRLYSGLSADG